MNPVARRYALALYGEAQDKNAVDRIDEDMAVLGETLSGSRDLVAFFESPVVAREKKEAVVGRLFDGKVSDVTLRFLRLLVEKEREDMIVAITDAYGTLRDERIGIVEAHVKTARPLGYDETQELEKALEARTGKQVRMKMDVEPSLIGGLVVRIGDQVYDRSVQHQLDQLRDQFHERAFLSQN